MAISNGMAGGNNERCFFLGQKPISSSLLGLWSSLGHLYHQEMDIYTESGRGAFIAWWFKHGQLEYKGCSEETNNNLIDEYHSIDYFAKGELWPISPLMRFIYNSRTDLQRSYPHLSVTANLFGYWQWWIIFGHKEYNLAHALPRPMKTIQSEDTRTILSILAFWKKCCADDWSFTTLEQDLNCILYWWVNKRLEADYCIGNWLDSLVLNSFHALAINKGTKALYEGTTRLMNSILMCRPDLSIFRDDSSQSRYWEWWSTYAIRDYRLDNYGLPLNITELCETNRFVELRGKDITLPVSSLLETIYRHEAINSTCGPAVVGECIAQWLRDGGLIRFANISPYLLTPEYADIWLASRITEMKDTRTIERMTEQGIILMRLAIETYVKRALSIIGFDNALFDDWIDDPKCVMRGGEGETALGDILLSMRMVYQEIIGRKWTQEPKMIEKKTGIAGNLHIIGYPRGIFGIGEDARLVHSSASLAGFKSRLYQAIRPQNATPSLSSEICAGQPGQHNGINVYCMPAFDTIAYYFDAGPNAFEVGYNIGLWQWELSEFPRTADFAFDLIDEIWTISSFTAQALAKSTNKPIYVIPLPITTCKSGQYNRSSFGIPESDFTFLSVLDGASYIARKNPLGVIEAFQRTFTGNEKVRLVIKAMNIKHSEIWRECINRSMSDERLTLLTDVYDEQKMASLYNISDCVVSLHRAEGFGRVIANSLLYGKPVIASSYSGPLDFISNDTAYLVQGMCIPVAEGDYLLARGGTWFNPDLDSAAEKMRHVFESREEAVKKALDGKKNLEMNYSIRSCADFICARVDEILGRS